LEVIRSEGKKKRIWKGTELLILDSSFPCDGRTEVDLESLYCPLSKEGKTLQREEAAWEHTSRPQGGLPLALGRDFFGPYSASVSWT